MNQGLFPFSGALSGARKVKAVNGRSSPTTQNTIYAVDVPALSARLGLTAYTTTPTLGARTRLYAAFGRGAARLFQASVAGNCTYRLEVLVDGKIVYDRTISNGATAEEAQSLVGQAYSSAPAWFSLDYLPFDSSFEVYITITVSSVAANWCYIVEEHE